MTAPNRCPSCGGFLFEGSACAICRSDAAGDDDDFDFFAARTADGRSEISLELENVTRLSAPPPGMTALAPQPVPSDRPRTMTPPPKTRPEIAQGSTERTDRTSSRPVAGPDAVAKYAHFPEPNTSATFQLSYFVRVFNRRARLAEKATLLRRTARGLEVDLESRYAKLGQALFDEPNEVRRFPELASLAQEAQVASEALAAIVSTKESIAARSERAKELAASRLERASAALAPIEEVERDARHAMMDANARVAAASEALLAAERALRDAVTEGRTDADTRSKAEREIDTQRARAAAAQRAQRDAALKASDARRRVLVEASRVAEAAAAMDNARLTGRAELRETGHAEHDAAERFHHACAALGRAGFDLAAGQTLKGTFWDARKTRESYDAIARHADMAERARETFDVSTFDRGRAQAIAVAVAVLLAILVAAAR